MAISGETLQERSKGKDVRTSNIVAAKVRVVFALELAGILGILRHCCRSNPRICALKFWPADATGWPREEGRVLPVLLPIVTGHLSLISFYRHCYLSIWYLF